MSLLPFLVYFNRRGTHIAPQKLKVSGLRCYTLLVEELPFFVSQDSSSAHPLFSSWGTAETLCCVPSHAGRFTSLLTPTTNWQSKGSGQARDVLTRRGYYNSRLSSLDATRLRECETGVMNSLKAAFVGETPV